MSMPAELAFAAPPLHRQASLWLGAGAAVLFAHLAFAYMVQSFANFAPLPDAVEEAMVVDLTPLPFTAPESVATETLAEAPVEEQQPLEETTEAVEPDVVEADTAEPEPTEGETSEFGVAQAEPSEIVEAEPDVMPEEPEVEPVEPEVVEAQPELVEPILHEPVEPEPVITSEVVAPLPEVVPPPPPRPVVEPVKKVEKLAPKKAGKPPAKKPRETRVADATKKTDAKPTVSSRASKASTAPKINPARWHSQVRAAVARRVGRIRGTGSVSVRFVVSSSGSVVSASISRSSGDPGLDAKAVSAVRSARVPAPPAGLSGQHSFAIPLTFR